MKKKVLLSLCYLLSVLSLSTAQDVLSHTFENGVGGVTFTETDVLTAVSNGDGIRVYLELGRVGAIQTVAGPLKSGGNDPKDVYALGILEFSADMELEKETLQWIKPEGVLAKKFNILEKPGAILGTVLATQDDCVGIFDVEDKYPDLGAEFDWKGGSTDAVKPGVYYENRLTYTMLGKVKGFKIRKTTVDANGEETVEKKEMEFDPYRNSTKKDYYVSVEANECDPNTGKTWASHGRLIAGEFKNRANLYRRELVVFDENGKEANRTEINFDKPHDLQYSNFFYAEDGVSVEGKVEVYTQLHGFGYKKLNPSPDVDQRILYEWDENGELTNELTLSMPAEDAKIFYGNRGTDKSSYLAFSAAKKAYYFIPGQDEKAGSITKIEASSPLAKGLVGNELSIPGATLKLVGRAPIGDQVLLTYNATKVTQQSGAPPVEKWIGNLFVWVDAAGAITATQSLLGGNKHKVRFYESSQGIVLLAVGGGKLELYNLTEAGAMSELYKMKESAASASSIYLPENEQLVITAILANKNLEVQLVNLK